MSNYTDQHIDDYLMNRLSKNELTEFEYNMQNNKELYNSVQLRKLIIKGIKSNEKDKLKSRLKIIHNEVNKKHQKSKYILWRRVAAVAAVFLVIMAYFTFSSTNKVDSKELYASNFEAYPISLVNRSDEGKDELIQLNSLYRNKEYKAALAIIHQIQEKEELNSRLQLAAGICLMELDKTTEARSYFKMIINKHDLRLTETAHWYTALSFIKENNLTTAKEELSKILINPKSKLHPKANKLLKQLPAI